MGFREDAVDRLPEERRQHQRWAAVLEKEKEVVVLLEEAVLPGVE
jgi:hypothetical protein